MKYRILALMGLLALSSTFLQAQDYDDIYYDASKSTTGTAKTKVVTPAKTVAVYGEVPEKYKEAVQVNYSTNRDVDEYNRRGAYDPSVAPTFEVDINGDTIYFNNDTIYEEAFANTRRIERFYNPDIVILSDDDDLVELYYDESPTVNLIVGTDWGYSSYYPWYTGWYDPWYIGYGWYSPWHWHSPWYYGYHHWGWGYYSPWYYSSWRYPYWGHRYGWNYGWWDSGHVVYSNRPHHVAGSYSGSTWRSNGHRAGLATNRNGRSRVDAVGSNRNSIGARGASSSSRGSSVGTTSRSRGGYATGRSGGNMGSRNSSGVTTRSGSVSRSASSSGGNRSYTSGSRSSGSYSGGSRSYSGSSSSSHSSGSYSGGGSRGSSGGGGGGSHGGSSGGGGHRR